MTPKRSKDTRTPEHVPVIICIDIEPDDRLIDRSERRPWKGFELSAGFFSTLRDRLAQATGRPVHYSWFLRLDPQIALTYGSSAWAAETYAGTLADLMREGDEIGVHAHGYRWDQASGWVADYRNQEWIDHCVRSSVEAYTSVFQRRCESFRFGDRWMSNPTMQTLEELGVRFDLTLEPGHPATANYMRGETATGGPPDCRLVPQHPYRPARADFRREDTAGGRRIWEIPLSSGFVYRWARPVIEPYRCIPGAGRYPLHLTLGLWQRTAPFHRVMDGLLYAGVPYLAFAVRSDLPLRRQMPRMRETFERLLMHPSIGRFTFSTPAELVAGFPT